MKPIVALLAVLAAVAGGGQVLRAQSAAPLTTQSTEPKAKRENLVRDFKSLETQVNQKRIKCRYCEGVGKVKMTRGPFGQRGPGVVGLDHDEAGRCLRCDGIGTTLDPHTVLDAYLAYCDFAASHAPALAERRHRRIREQLDECRSRWLTEITHAIGTVPAYWCERPRPQRSGWVPAEDRVLTQLARDVVLSKTSPVGRSIAFTGRVINVTSENKQRVAQVAIVSVAEPPVACAVIVPNGLRWVGDAEVRVIGRVIDPSDYRNLIQQNPDAVLVRPYAGTE